MTIRVNSRAATWSNGRLVPTDRYYWYAWNADRFGTLTDAGNVANPASIAYRETFKWMAGAIMISPCTRNGSVWICTLTQSGGYRALASLEHQRQFVIRPTSNLSPV